MPESVIRVVIQALLLALLIECLATNHWDAAAGMGVALSITVRVEK